MGSTKPAFAHLLRLTKTPPPPKQCTPPVVSAYDIDRLEGMPLTICQPLELHHHCLWTHAITTFFSTTQSSINSTPQFMTAPDRVVPFKLFHTDIHKFSRSNFMTPVVTFPNSLVSIIMLLGDIKWFRGTTS